MDSADTAVMDLMAAVAMDIRQWVADLALVLAALR